MKKHSITIIALFGFFPFAFSQKEKIPVKGRIYYNFRHQLDSTAKEYAYRETTVLYYGARLSYYGSFDRFTAEMANRNTAQKQGENHTPVFVRGSKDTYFTNLGDTKIYKVRDFGGSGINQTYLMPEALAVPRWTIYKETRSIGGYTCQKAVASFCGRNYTAWFCSDIPYPYGPWKLNGLPGLIFEANDDKDQVAFTFNRIEPEINTAEFMPVINNYVTTPEADFEKMRKAYYDNFQSGGNGGTQTTGSVTGPNGSPVQRQPSKNKYNNPIDLISKVIVMPYNY